MNPAELPDPAVNPELYDIVKTDVICGPHGALNVPSLCIKHSECTKQYLISQLPKICWGTCPHWTFETFPISAIIR